MLRYRLREYATPDGRKPFNEWIRGLRDIHARARIRTRLDRLELGNLGDHVSVGSCVFFMAPGTVCISAWRTGM